MNIKKNLSFEIVSEQRDQPNITEQEIGKSSNEVSEDYVQDQVAVSETNDLYPAQEQEPQVIEVIPEESFIERIKEITPGQDSEHTSEQVSEQPLEQVQPIDLLSAVTEPIPLSSDFINES